MSIRVTIDLPDYPHPTVLAIQDSVHNVLIHAFAQHGVHPAHNQPAAWGFGTVTHPVEPPGKAPSHLRQLQRIVVGSTDPTLAEALAKFTPEDLTELSQVPGSGLDLRTARLTFTDHWIPTSVLPVFPITPIRVLSPRDGSQGSVAQLTLDARWMDGINRTMSRRFGRPFQLRVIPDDLYIRERQGRLVTSLPVKRDARGHLVYLPGLTFPAILTGPSEDLRDAWFNGLGAGTGMGFGCLGFAE